MKSEHRHELKTNELADWIAHIPQYVRQNLRTVIGVSVIIIGIISWPLLAKKKRAGDTADKAQFTQLITELNRAKGAALRSGGMDASNSLLFLANQLEMQVSEAKDPIVAALILIKRAEALRADLHYTLEDASGDVLASQITQSQKAYRKAIEKVRGNPDAHSLVAMATFGLGLCAEELGELDNARAIYNRILANTDFEGTIFPRQAELRLESLADSIEDFVFVKADIPSGEAAAPQTFFETTAPPAAPVPPPNTQDQVD